LGTGGGEEQKSTNTAHRTNNCKGGPKMNDKGDNTKIEGDEKKERPQEGYL